MRAIIVDKLQELRTEAQKIQNELDKLRPRVQYLETTLLGLGGGIVALEDLLSSKVEIEYAEHTS